MRWLDVSNKAAQGPRHNKAMRGSPENKAGGAGSDAGPANALSGVDFASDAAAELAIKNGLTAADFRGKSASGANGFTVADVRELAG